MLVIHQAQHHLKVILAAMDMLLGSALILAVAVAVLVEAEETLFHRLEPEGPEELRLHPLSLDQQFITLVVAGVVTIVAQEVLVAAHQQQQIKAAAVMVVEQGSRERLIPAAVEAVVEVVLHQAQAAPVS
jgi:hypothetical protein